MPRDIVAIVVVQNDREERFNLRGHTAEIRFRHLQDAIRRWDDEWTAYHLGLSPDLVKALRQFHELRQEAADRKRIRAGKQTAKKMKQKAVANREAVLAVHRVGYPAHIGPRDRVGYVARKTRLSQPTVRKYLPSSRRRKSASA
jgi:hypothetical protein